jgi:hypothetical protein
VDINENQFHQNFENDFDLVFRYINLKRDNEKGGEIDKFRAIIENYILTLDTKVSREFVEIAERIKTDRNNNYISLSRAQEIITSVMGKYDAVTLSLLQKHAFLFYYSDKSELNESEQVVLNPEWITHAVYKIIRYAHEKKGIVTDYDIQQALMQEDEANLDRDNKLRITRESIPYIKNTLVYFQIAYYCDSQFVFPMCLEMQYRGDNTTLEFDEKDSFQAKYIISIEETKIRQQFPKDIVSSMIINNHENLCASDDGKYMLVTRTSARFYNKDTNAKVEIVRVDDYNLYLIGKGSDFETYSEIVIEYAEKLQKYLRDNYSKFARAMPDISITYGKDTKQGLSISGVRQSIIDKIQKGYPTKKESILSEQLERLENKVINLENFLTNELISKTKILYSYFNELKHIMENHYLDSEDLQTYLESYMSAIKENNKEKAKSKIAKLSKLIGETLVSMGVQAAVGNIPLLIPSINEIIQYLSQMIPG